MSNAGTAAVSLSRVTKETDISLSLEYGVNEPGASSVSVDTGAAFFDHMLGALAFHGRFGLVIKAKGDIDVDYHHLVEDTGLVLGAAFHELFQRSGAVERFGYSVIPMDDALCEAAVDVAERPFLVYRADFPQACAGTFPLCLVKEFFQAFTQKARVNLHLICRYGENSHHMAEALFKAFGRALAAAYAPRNGERGDMSSKGAVS
ncbi:MAG: imidazoleglycerol-phosphate dehydratase HisB [Spirochaetales bacterium]|jgi:imidazoleglycerol-phosphate dehydratase|nr:imidazoleglycerol-phosphate dehydratase HisB [Spirochaetales bacterium]